MKGMFYAPLRSRQVLFFFLDFFLFPVFVRIMKFERSRPEYGRSIIETKINCCQGCTMKCYEPWMSLLVVVLEKSPLGQEIGMPDSPNPQF